MNNLNELLGQVGGEVLESLAFLLPVESGPPSSDAASMTAQVAFHGPFDGLVRVRVPRDMLAELASNMLGLEAGEAASGEQQADALGELANVICGNLLPKVAGAEAVFDVAPAQVVPSDAAGREPPCVSASLAFDAGNVVLELVVPGGVRVPATV